MQAYAVAVTEANIRTAIRSEAGRGFNLELALQWLEEHEDGWFIRDEGSTFDCMMFRPEVFEELYMFSDIDNNDAVFRKIVKI